MPRVGLFTTDTLPGHKGHITVVASPLIVQISAPSAQEALDRAMSRLRQEAEINGANCVVGVGFSHFVTTVRGAYDTIRTEVVVMAYGTGVRVNPPPDIS
jgi:hypothetical protein